MNEIALTWTIPTETTDGAAFGHRGQTKICRAIDQPSIKQASQCNAIATLATPRNEKSANALTYVTPENAGANDYATYAVEVENDRGRSAGLSNQVQVPTAVVSTLNGTPAPQLTGDAVLVTANITARNEALQQTVQLRRSEKDAPQESVVARRPLQSPHDQAANVELRDETFSWEKKYSYRVVITASARMPDGNTVEFDGSASVPFEVVTHDVFPPAVPTGVQAVFSGQFAGQQPSIDLTWNPDLDRDQAGYFVYRRLASEQTPTKLNSQPVSPPAYTDKAIQPGNTYLYSVSAVDERGNESKRSEEASESVPK
jgi:hypothetical protein